MKAFVTGATGFIGSHLADTLIGLEEYKEVRCLVRNDEKWLRGRAYHKISGDMHDTEALAKGMRNADVVFHLAGVVKAPAWKTFERINVEATENVLQTAREEGVKRVIVLSSLAAAGPSRGTPRTEDDPMLPVSMYGRSKKRMEEMIGSRDWGGTSVTVLRPPAVYGPREDQIYTFFKLFSNRICPIIGDGEHPRVSMVYVMDLVQGILDAANHKASGTETYFISGAQIHTWDEIRETTTRVFGKKAVPIYIKPGLVMKIATVVENTASLFGSYPVINREKANELTLEWTCSIDKARKQLHYEPKYSLAEGISRTIHWYKMHHWL